MLHTLRKIAENINTEQKASGTYRGSVLFDAPMSEYTTFKIGGAAAVLFEPSDVPSLCRVLDCLRREKLPYFILGGGSNLVVSDSGLPCAVISACGLRGIEVCSESGQLLLCCGAGTSFHDAAEFCIRHGYSGLETFSGLPGTIGGAAFMNARCYDVSFSDVLVSAEYIPAGIAPEKNAPPSAEEKMCSPAVYFMNKADWAYKCSPFRQGRSAAKETAGGIIVGARVRIRPGNPHDIKSLSESFIEDRRLKGHFKYPSAGSVFKNNRSFGKPSGQLIDEAGLRGFRCGGAQIAPWHGNIIINCGGATASDIKKLVDIAREKVFASAGFMLECEIIFTDDIISR
ncbi:MAG: UDP-N-acetylmuramate dehydrogenase [Bacteroides sp.]|nr:UDP-N-acetylmuramate dehydrogenase [Prevotella sp.]MCM1407144.1 UDP-N-acetylmuramate dehydrogenase [Treponema brennaborense]MCM1470296.1 UDP-N-acetylmuramate dehydrogenase [Bacteroides sp.]